VALLYMWDQILSHRMLKSKLQYQGLAQRLSTSH
jgi:hypothetical protein